MTHDVIGKPSRNLIDYQVLTGGANYLDDLRVDGVLVGKLLYSEHACALIKKIDTSKAKEIPGVVEVITHKDIPGENSYLLEIADQPVLMENRVNYLGDAVAAVSIAGSKLLRPLERTARVVFADKRVSAARVGSPQVAKGKTRDVDIPQTICGDAAAVFITAGAQLPHPVVCFGTGC